MQQLGDKTEARKLAMAAGVKVVPGTSEPVPDVEAAQAFAAEAGYPVMLKAAMGGGGRGMRVVRRCVPTVHVSGRMWQVVHRVVDRAGS
jgi:biotin carboxylase